MRPLPPVVLALTLTALGCGAPRLSSSAGELYVETASLTLPDAFVGFQSQQSLLVFNAARGARQATLTVTPPFVLDLQSLDVPGGDAARVVVRFAPTAEGPAAGTVRLTSEGATLEVELHALGRSAPDCVTQSPCRPAHFDPAVGGCVETILPDETQCQPANACLAGARCFAGECLGVPLSCDDDNRCTADACSEEQGCLHVDSSASCPAPSDPCRVPTCDPKVGCGVADAPDGTACGAADCVTANICLAGQCRAVAVPDGATCAPETPCQGKGTCVAQRCQQPAPGPLVPAWRYGVPDDRSLYFNGLADAAGNLYWAECADALGCDLVSVTRGGFARYRATLSRPSHTHVNDAERGRLVLVGDLVVAGLSRTSIEARRAADGSLAWSTNLLVALGSGLPGDGDAPDEVNVGPVVDDGHGGLLLRARFFQSLGCFPSRRDVLVSLDAATGAVRWSRDFLEQQLNALVSDEAGQVYAAGFFLGDGGVDSGLLSFTRTGTPRWSAPGPYAASLSVAGGRVALEMSLSNAADGGAIEPPGLPTGDVTVMSDDEVLLGATAGFSFATTTSPCCQDCPCAALIPMPHLRSVRLSDAAVNWEVSLWSGLPPQALPTLSAAALTSAGDVVFAQGPPPVYSNSVPAPPRLRAVTGGGAERFSCELPGAMPYSSVVYGGPTVLQQGRWVTVRREQCFVCNRNPPPEILAFDVPGLELATQGWPTTGGSNRRSGRPR